MKIIISGYGRMGKEVEKIALQRKHQLVAKIDTEKEWKQLQSSDNVADVVIDFSLPKSAVDNISRCFTMGIPIVTGTTGWYNKMGEIEEKCIAKNATLFYSPNFSVGVNLFFKVNKKLAKMMSNFDAYNVSLEETHHIHKLDSPSGTAIKAAEGIIENYDLLTDWGTHITTKEDVLPILSHREGEVPGTHKVTYESEADRIILIHEAKNRSGFALGAVLAAEFVYNKQGIFTMDDLLKL